LPTALLEHVAAPEPYGERVEFEEVLDGLPELTRTVLLLRYQVGLSVPEIATIIERSYKGTESLLSRARTTLRSALNEAGFGNE
jgi:DNA-directed RNA polymerase specialized sigma24 family protein